MCIYIYIYVRRGLHGAAGGLRDPGTGRVAWEVKLAIVGSITIMIVIITMISSFIVIMIMIIISSSSSMMIVYWYYYYWYYY